MRPIVHGLADAGFERQCGTEAQCVETLMVARQAAVRSCRPRDSRGKPSALAGRTVDKREIGMLHPANHASSYASKSRRYCLDVRLNIVPDRKLSTSMSQFRCAAHKEYCSCS